MKRDFYCTRVFLQWLRIILNVKERGASRKAAGREVRQASGETVASEKPRAKGGGCCNRRCRRAAASRLRAVLACILAYIHTLANPLTFVTRNRFTAGVSPLLIQAISLQVAVLRTFILRT